VKRRRVDVTFPSELPTGAGPTDLIAEFRLTKLRCLEEYDGRGRTGRSRPYVWTALLWGDDSTVLQPPRFGGRGPATPRVVLKDGMSAGEEVDIPGRQNTFRFKAENAMSFAGFAAVVVVLFKRFDLPDKAVNAAYATFLQELPRISGDIIFAYHQQHGGVPAADDEMAWAEILDDVQDELMPLVKAAAQSSLSSWELFKLRVFGDLDETLGAKAESVNIKAATEHDELPVERDFTLSFQRSKTVTVKRWERPRRRPLGERSPSALQVTERFEIAGHLDARHRPRLSL